MFIKPENVIPHLELLPGMTVADFGCGPGYYTILLAHAVGASGKVYAYDIRKEALAMVRSRARIEHLLNIETVWADLETSGATKLRDASVDALVISNILFQVDDKKAVVNEAGRIIKNGGRVMAIEWSEEKGIGGPPLQDRLSAQEVKRLFAENGFVMEKEFNAGDQHYGLLFKKQ